MAVRLRSVPCAPPILPSTAMAAEWVQAIWVTRAHSTSSWGLCALDKGQTGIHSSFGNAGDAVEEVRARIERAVAGRWERPDAFARDFWRAPARCRSCARSDHPARSPELRTHVRRGREFYSGCGLLSLARPIAGGCERRADEYGS